MKQHGAIRVGYLEYDPGFSAVDPQSGKLMGVVNDYIEYASKCFEQPLEFHLVGLDSQEALIQAVRDNKIDMIFHVNQNPYYAEENGLSLSNTVLSVPFAAVTAQEAFNESAENTVAIAKENSKYNGMLLIIIQTGILKNIIRSKMRSRQSAMEKQTVLSLGPDRQ